MRSILVSFALLCLLVHSIECMKFESNERISLAVENARNSVSEMRQTAPISQRTALVNPDPAHIKINGNSGRVTLTPCGLGETPAQDTANLEWAIKHFSDIKLQSGEFHLDRTIEAVDFVGTIKGSGANNTVIVGRGPLVNGEYVFPLLTEDLQQRVYPTGLPHLIWFHSTQYADPNEWAEHQTDLTLRELSIRMDGVGPSVTLAQQPLRTVWTMLVITGPNASFVLPQGNVPHASINIKNVNFIAQQVPYNLNGVAKSNSNVAAGLVVYGGEAWTTAVDALNGWTEYDHSPFNVQLSIENCQFMHFHQFAYGAEGFSTTNAGSVYVYPTEPIFPKATVSVSDNVFYNCGNGAGLTGTGGYTNLLVANSDVDIVITDNFFVNNPAMGVAVLNGVADSFPKSSPNIEISNNKFHMIGGDYSVAAVFILDVNAFDSVSSNAVITIEDNAFYGEAGFAQFHVLSVMGKGISVLDNEFYGTAAGGIAFSPANIFDPSAAPLPTVASVVSGNDFSSMTTFAVPVFFGKGAFYCQAFVSNAAEFYDDNGASTTNVVTVVV